MGLISGIFTLGLLHASGILVACVIPIIPLFASFPAIFAFLVFVLIICLVSILVGRNPSMYLTCYALLVILAVFYCQGAMQGERQALQQTLGSREPGVALITGSTSGIGFECASMLVSNGWTVFLHGRSLASMQAAKVQLLREIPDADPSRLVVVDQPGDLSSFQGTHNFARAVLATPQGMRLSLLVCNAGMQKQQDGSVSVDGFEMMMQVNVLSHALLQEHLLTENPRLSIVHVSSLSHMSYSIDQPLLFEWDQMETLGNRYGRTKLLQILFARASSRDHRYPDMRVVSVHPGGCGTKLSAGSTSETSYGLPEMLLSLLRPLWHQLLLTSWFPSSHCASVVLSAALDSGHSGAFYSEYRATENGFFFHPVISEETVEKVYNKIQLHLVEHV